MRLITVAAFVFGLLLSARPGASQPASKKKEPTPAVEKSADTPPLNTCGCYEDSNGTCQCARKNKCGCPGECEPTGCEDKRRKEIEKEAKAELKRQQDEDKKRNAELAKKREDEEREDARKRERNLRGLRLTDPK